MATRKRNKEMDPQLDLARMDTFAGQKPTIQGTHTARISRTDSDEVVDTVAAAEAEKKKAFDEQMKEWCRENLRIEIADRQDFDGHRIEVRLSFADEKESFSRDYYWP